MQTRGSAPSVARTDIASRVRRVRSNPAVPKRKTRIQPEVPDSTPMEHSKPDYPTVPKELDLDKLRWPTQEDLNSRGRSEDWMTDSPPSPAKPLAASVMKTIIETVVHKFQTSYDYHGTLWTSIPGLPSDQKSVRDLLRRLVDSKRITFRTSGMDVNPAIQRLPDRYYNLSKAIAEDALNHLTLFPTVREMSRRVPKREDEPFTSMLERGHAHLEFACFDLSILEQYRNEPRYFYSASDVQGHIYVKDRRSGFRKKDKVYLDTFGFAYNKRMTRAVAVFIRYLKQFTPEHQQQWRAKMFKPGSFKLHPDYFAMSVLGNWGTHVPILDALLMELECINGLCAEIGWKPLFRKTFKDEKPPGFTFLIRPTSMEFNSFALLLDKIMSDNLSKEFFRGRVPLETETTRKDGKLIVQQKGTIQLLEEWFKTNLINVSDPKAIPKMVEAFREVRKLRQGPAHVQEPNKFDQKYFRLQRDLIIRAYLAIQTIRLFFGIHPMASSFEVPEVLKEGRIRDF